MRGKYAMTFGLLSGASAYAAVGAQGTLGTVLLVYASISLALVGSAYALNRPSLLLKAPSGQISLPGRVLFLPYHALSYLSLALQRITSKEEPFSWVSQSVALGRIPLQADRTTLRGRGVRSVLDLTAELGAARFVRELRYLNLPLLDGTAPSLEQLKSSVSWMNEHVQSGPLLVHCALGHGRSATVAAAFLASGQRALGASEVLKKIEAVRPGVGLNQPQRSVLEEYTEWHLCDDAAQP